jgi:hypothetical protein
MSNWIGGEHVRLIVASANQLTYKHRTVVLVGVRHWDGLMREQADAMGLKAQTRVKEVQGFVDNRGVFLDRKEALAVAIASGQLNSRRTKTTPLDELHSEDLW